MKNYTLYLVPGFLTDRTIYKEFLLDERLNCKVLEFIDPLDKDEPIEEYAKRMSELIDTNENVALLGTSFGGILSMEIAKHINVEKIILVSSVKDRSELNPMMKVKNSSKLLDIVPDSFVKSAIVAGYSIGNKIVPDLKEIRNEEIGIMIHKIDGTLEKWIIKKVNTWKGKNEVKDFLHLHGDKDPVFPIKNIKDYELVENGNHNMIIVKLELIRDRVVKFLS
ncbi:alpha/beta hydrolase [Flavobacteriales bacterium]|nr:alpha/beta hydrolase [Flavobacteriales bacterium]